jgi:hypothetical protein
MARRADLRSGQGTPTRAETGADEETRPAETEGPVAEPEAPVRRFRGGVVASPLPAEPPFGSGKTATKPDA